MALKGFMIDSLVILRCFFVEHKEISVDEFKRVSEDESKSTPAMQRKVRKEWALRTTMQFTRRSSHHTLIIVDRIEPTQTPSWSAPSGGA